MPRRKAPLLLFWRLITTVRNWPLYFKVRDGKVKSETFTYDLRNGFHITSRQPTIDGLALNEIWLEKVYEPTKAGVPFDWSTCRTIVDVGAHIGTFTLYAASRAPHARIISVEPEPGNIKILKKNIHDSGLDSRVKVVEAGIGTEEKIETFYVSDESSWHHSLYKRDEAMHEIQMKLVPLQTIFERENIDACDFLKMDCEGGEYEALYRMPKETLKRIRFIAMEMHHYSKDPTHTPERLQEFLRENGFQVTSTKPHFCFAQRLS